MTGQGAGTTETTSGPQGGTHHGAWVPQHLWSGAHIPPCAPSPPPPVTVTCFHCLREFVGGVSSPDLLRPRWPHTGTFPETLANPASSSCHPGWRVWPEALGVKGGRRRGPGWWQRIRLSWKPALREMGAAAWLKGVLEVRIDLSKWEGRLGRNSGRNKGRNVGMRQTG